jgi:hypothetical protein
MAGDWLKVEEVTPDKPEIAILARKLGVSQGDAFLEWFRVYRWAGRSTCPGLVPNLSLADADMLSGARPGTCAALASTEIGWMQSDGHGVGFAKWDRHNSKSAKSRALEQEKKRNQRSGKPALSPEPSPTCPDDNGTKPGTRREETRGEYHSSKDDRETIGNSPPLGQSSGSSRSSGYVRKGKAADLTDLDWSYVSAIVLEAARKVPPLTEKDRRAWLRFGVLAATAFSEQWLVESAAAAASMESKKSRQALFVGVLKTKASEQYGVDDASFLSLTRGIEIPTGIWQSAILEVQA